jgi:hypothetical protein
MSESFSSILTITGIALLVTLVWGATIAIVFWDTGRRGIGSGKQLLWLALVALLPGVGFAAYLIARLLLHKQSRREGTQPFPARRATAAKRPPEARVYMPTVAGVDLIKQTTPAAQGERLKPEARPEAQPPARRQANTRYALEIAEGPHRGQRWILEQLPVRIGRGSSAFIRLNDDLGISRHHAEIYEQKGAIHVRDLQSTHGTYVNGQRVFDNSLNVGDEIRIGASVLILRAYRERT